MNLACQGLFLCSTTTFRSASGSSTIAALDQDSTHFAVDSRQARERQSLGCAALRSSGLSFYKRSTSYDAPDPAHREQSKFGTFPFLIPGSLAAHLRSSNLTKRCARTV